MSKQHRKIPDNSICSICGLSAYISPTGRLVCDHNHITGVIRGYLCDKCNSWLDILERHPEYYYNRIVDETWRAWVWCFASNINKHLNSSTGFSYYSSNDLKKRERIRLSKRIQEVEFQQSSLISYVLYQQTQ